MLKAVFFDLDGTLYDRDRLATELFTEQYDAFAGELRGLPREQFLRDAHAMDDHGHGVKETGYQRLVRQWGLDDMLAQRLLTHFWDNYDSHCRLSGDVRRTLDELRARRLRLGVITNGGGTRQRRKIAALGLAAAFDVILVSEEEGVRKPDAEIFRRALHRCGAAAHEGMFVGDHPVADVEGAHRAGLIPVWRHVPYWPAVVPDVAVIRELSEVLPICDALG
ncbi:MAG TPA: HAD-IA family hydrolase [Steroidobacteraceae bacterium]|nr:HAD-IA family hydrolase [Steroidobacteraceae bacterium]